MGQVVNANVWVPGRDPRLGGNYISSRFVLPTQSRTLRLGQMPEALPAQATEQITRLCTERPEVCARVCQAHPGANAFFRTACPNLSGTYVERLGQHRAVRAVRATRAVPGESPAIRATPAIPYRQLGQEETAPPEVSFTDKAIAWVQTNPMLAAGAGLATLFLLGGKR